MTYEFVYITIHYQCGHDAIRPEFAALIRARIRARERWPRERCEHCADQLARRYAITREVEREQMEEVAI